jgi:hypothetical protein
MTFLSRPGDLPSFSYAGQPMQLMAGPDDLPAGSAVARMTMPPRFAGPIPHAHDEFDEGVMCCPAC